MSLIRNEKITDAIQQGIINTAIPKTQWGSGKHSSTKKEAAPKPQILRKFLTKSPSSRDVINLVIGDKDKDKDKDKGKPAKPKVVTRSKSIGNLLKPGEEEEKSKHKEENKEEKDASASESSLSSSSSKRAAYHARVRSNSDLRPLVSYVTPTNAGILQAIANLVDLTGPGNTFFFFKLFFILKHP